MQALVVAAILLALLCIWMFWRRIEFCKVLSRIPGPKSWPIVGNALQLKRDPHEFVIQLKGWTDEYQVEGILCMWLGSNPIVGIFKPEYVEELLSSQKNITKAPFYNYLHPWLGKVFDSFGEFSIPKARGDDLAMFLHREVTRCLLNSTGSKWKSRRRLLTPTFHYKILNDFVLIHQKQSEILVEILKAKADQDEFDIVPYVTLCVLDIICETSMGINIKAQFGNNSEYSKAVFSICKLIQERQKSPWLWPNIIYNMTSSGRAHQNMLRILHGFTNKVIDDRIRQRNEHGETNGNISGVTEIYGASNRRVRAFLDLLLEEYDQGNITKEGVREEVDTFMFEGHDTTSASLQWTIHLLGLHPDVQSRLQKEVDNFYGSVDGNVKPDQLHNLSFLECVVKEALRLYPSVPLLGRELTEEVNFGPYKVPKGCSVLVAPMALHRNPEVWDEPDTFKPDRFLHENNIGRHPFAYIPFSAGPRNCIGQKFAMMEEKIVLASILRHFNVISTQATDDIRKSAEIIFKSTEGILVKLESRNF